MSSPEEAKAFVEEIREEFPDARHHCWAYVAGTPGSSHPCGMSDDGEPHGTAGRPGPQRLASRIGGRKKDEGSGADHAGEGERASAAGAHQVEELAGTEDRSEGDQPPERPTSEVDGSENDGNPDGRDGQPSR